MQGNKAKLVDWKLVNEVLHKATSITVGVAYKVSTPYEPEFEGRLVFKRENVLEFRDSDGKYHNASLGKCKLRRILV